MTARNKRHPLPKELVRAQQLLEQDYFDLNEFAFYIGVSRQWVNQLIKQDRIVGAVYFLGKHYVPKDPRVLRGDDRMRNGRIEDYIDDWELRHYEVIREEMKAWENPYIKEIRSEQ